MCKLAFFMTTKNSEKSTGTRLALLFAFRWKNWEYLFLSELHRNMSAGQYVSSLQRYGPDIISDPMI